MDHQVKVRGYRIELGEIESVLLQHNQVKDVVVLSRGDEPDNTRLVAYVVSESIENSEDNSDTEDSQATFDPSILIDSLRIHMQGQLPAYMDPSAIVLIDSIPVTNNGKVDRLALLELDVTNLRSQNYVAPGTEIEFEIANIWSDVLQVPVDTIGINDSFFMLGGHSILAIKLVSQVNMTLETSIVLSDIFRLQEIVQLASHIEELKTDQRDNQLDIARLGQDADEDEEVEEFDL